MYTLPIYFLHWNIKWVIQIVISEGIKGTRVDLDVPARIQMITQTIREQHFETLLCGAEAWKMTKTISRKVDVFQNRYIR